MKSAFKRSVTIAFLLVALSNSSIYAVGRDGGSHFRWLDRFERWAVELLGDVITVPHG
jgi:uncharacterized RmlC-like cupin family protein